MMILLTVTIVRRMAMSGKIEDDDVDTELRMTPKQFSTHLMKKIYDFWAAKGHRVRVWVKPLKLDGREDRVWIVQSDLVDGLPTVGHKKEVHKDLYHPPVSPPLS